MKSPVWRMSGDTSNTAMADRTKDLEARLSWTLVRSEIEALIVENAYLLDRQHFAELVELYTEDCEVVRPLPPFDGSRNETLKGRAALTAHYAGPSWPETARTMRHVVANLRLSRASLEKVSGTVSLIGYRYEGDGPSLAIPMMVGDYEDEYRRVDECWRIHRRRIVIAFLNQALLDAVAAEGSNNGNR